MCFLSTNKQPICMLLNNNLLIVFPNLKYYLKVPLNIRCLNYYVLTSNKYNVLIGFILYCKTLLLLLRWATGKVRDRFGGIGRFKVGLRGNTLE